MNDVLWPFFAIPAFLLAFAVVVNLRRRNPEEPTDLIPNCLMTRAPIVFVTGPRSVFYFASYWNDLPVYLAAHGYDVRVMRLPWRHRPSRRQWVENLLTKQRVHLVLDVVTAEEMADLLRSHPPLSLTVPEADGRTGIADGLCFALHKGFMKWAEPSLPSPRAGSLGLGRSNSVKGVLLHEIREQAEKEWTDVLST